MKFTPLTVIPLFLTACSPNAPKDTAILEQRLKQLEAGVASLRTHPATPATATIPQGLSGLYIASRKVIGAPTQMDFATPRLCQMRFPNGEVITATYESKSGGILFDTKSFGGLIFAKLAGEMLQITQDDETIIYSKPQVVASAFTEADVARFVVSGTSRAELVKRSGKPKVELPSQDGSGVDAEFWLASDQTKKERNAFGGFMVRLKDDKVVKWDRISVTSYE